MEIVLAFASGSKPLKRQEEALRFGIVSLPLRRFAYGPCEGLLYL